MVRQLMQRVGASLTVGSIFVSDRWGTIKFLIVSWIKESFFSFVMSKAPCVMFQGISYLESGIRP